VTLAAAALASVVAVQALAQGGPGQMGERGWGMWDDDDRGMRRDGPFRRWSRTPERMLERVERRLGYLKTDLAITEAQTPQWNELAQAIRTTAKQRSERMQALFAGEPKAKTLPERVEQQEQFMAASLEELKQIKASLVGLYAVLTDNQKKEADEMVLPMVGMGGQRWGM
jgi:hypothetical protein